MNFGEERARYEARLVGRTIEKVIWSNMPCCGQPADANEIAGLELDGGEVVSFSGSGQIDVNCVWIEVEGL